MTAVTNKLFVCVAFLLFAAIARAQSAPTIAILILADAGDAAATYRNSVRPNFHESDPIDRPFVTHGTPLLAGFFAVDAGAKIGAAWWLDHHHHEKLGRVVSWVGIAASAWGIETSLRGYHALRR